ncbi:MAG: translation initiation factor IF-3 [Candidatus Shikimatogenerans sp. Tcar]|uniref:Translation initiation factor IF-3 n=1 Tax=Candidatus Shikimatogenerans sp. Tcar TaxID=3158565 RepID=A0AAU7QSA9_9FLAO
MIEKIKINILKKYKYINLIGINIKTGIYITKKILSIIKILKLDLVKIHNNNNINLYKIINYSKYIYNIKKKKKNKINKIKNINIKPNINLYDLKYRIKKIKKLLKNNIKIKINIFFKGRTFLYINNGKKIFKYILNYIKNKFFFIKKPFIKNRNMTMIIDKKR